MNPDDPVFSVGFSFSLPRWRTWLPGGGLRSPWFLLGCLIAFFLLEACTKQPGAFEEPSVRGHEVIVEQSPKEPMLPELPGDEGNESLPDGGEFRPEVREASEHLEPQPPEKPQEATCAQRPDAGGPCIVGQGACAAKGTMRCKADGHWECDAIPNSSAATAEICDGLDNDCDGLLDEGCFCDPTTWKSMDLVKPESQPFGVDGVFVSPAGDQIGWRYMTEDPKDGHPQDLYIELRDRWTGKLRHKLHVIHASSIYQKYVSWSPDGRLLAVRTYGSGGRGVGVWETATGYILQRHWDGDSGGLSSGLVFHPHGSLLAYGIIEQRHMGVAFWRPRTGEIEFRLRSNKKLLDNPNLIAISPDGRLVAVASQWGIPSAVVVWDLKTRKLLYSFDGGTGSERSQFTALAFGFDNRTLAVASAPSNNVPTKYLIQLREATTGKPLHTLQGHTSDVHTLAMSPRHGLLASASRGRTMKLWDISTGKLLHTKNVRLSWDNALSFGPNGRFLVTTNAKLWACPCTPGTTQRCYGASVGCAMQKSGALCAGLCKTGTQTCRSDGFWGPCQGQILPQEEIPKDQKDNDCDGIIDL